MRVGIINIFVLMENEESVQFKFYSYRLMFKIKIVYYA